MLVVVLELVLRIDGLCTVGLLTDAEVPILAMLALSPWRSDEVM